jgi:hypothetical protein
MVNIIVVVGGGGMMNTNRRQSEGGAFGGDRCYEKKESRRPTGSSCGTHNPDETVSRQNKTNLHRTARHSLSK